MSLKYKILIITDSLGFPRPWPEAVSYEETYISLLKNEFHNCDFIHQGRGGANIVELYNHTWYFHETLCPDLVFIQSGVVDCAPRALTLTEHHVVSRLPLLSGLLTNLVKKYSKQLRKVRRIRYTDIETYKEYTKRFEKLFSNVYWIGILPASNEYEEKLENIKQSIALFNGILESREVTGRFISTADFGDQDIMSDFHHLSKAGHGKMFSRLAGIISEELDALESKKYKS